MKKRNKILILVSLLIVLIGFGFYEANDEIYCWSTHGNAEYYYPKDKCDNIDREYLRRGDNPPKHLIFKKNA